MATYREALSNIDEELRFQLLGAILDASQKHVNYDILNEKYLSMYHFINNIMYWDETPQGAIYWIKEAEKYNEHGR